MFFILGIEDKVFQFDITVQQYINNRIFSFIQNAVLTQASGSNWASIGLARLIGTIFIRKVTMQITLPFTFHFGKKFSKHQLTNLFCQLFIFRDVQLIFDAAEATFSVFLSSYTNTSGSFVTWQEFSNEAFFAFM